MRRTTQNRTSPPCEAVGDVERHRAVEDSSRHCGFSLIELLAVLAIMAVLLALASGISGFARRKARESRARFEMELLRTAIQSYKLEYGCLPVTLSEPEVAPRLERKLKLSTARSPLDPWGSLYQYERASNLRSYSIYSRGPLTNNVADDIYP